MSDKESIPAERAIQLLGGFISHLAVKRHQNMSGFASYEMAAADCGCSADKIENIESLSTAFARDVGIDVDEWPISSSALGLVLDRLYRIVEVSEPEVALNLATAMRETFFDHREFGPRVHMFNELMYALNDDFFDRMNDPEFRGDMSRNWQISAETWGSDPELYNLDLEQILEIGRLLRTGKIPTSAGRAFMRATARGQMSPFDPNDVQRAADVRIEDDSGTPRPKPTAPLSGFRRGPDGKLQ